MFIQVIQSKTSRRQEVRDLLDEWATSMEDAGGWLGGTYGFTDDGDFLAVVRFESRELAMANSDDPRTSAFAERMAALMDGPVQFQDCDDVTVFLDGGSDDAGFVQVIRGHVDDPDVVKSGLLADVDAVKEMRPEIIGGTFAVDANFDFTQTVAFTDEDSARQGEQQEPPEEVREALEALTSGASFYDLREVWFESRD